MTAAVAADIDPRAPATPPGLADPVNRVLVVRMLAKGYSRRAAAEFVGCHVATIGRTAAADPNFRQALTQAEETVTMQALERVIAASPSRATGGPRPGFWNARPPGASAASPLPSAQSTLPSWPWALPKPSSPWAFPPSN